MFITISCYFDPHQDQGENVLHYAALSLKRNNEHLRQQEAEENACVYSRVRSRKEWKLPLLLTQKKIWNTQYM